MAYARLTPLADTPRDTVMFESQTSFDACLECGVCNESYSTDGRCTPKVLHCGHTVCSSCCRKMCKNGGLKCPFDRQWTYTDRYGISLIFIVFKGLIFCTGQRLSLVHPFSISLWLKVGSVILFWLHSCKITTRQYTLTPFSDSVIVSKK